jgi:hypothetical protein
MEYLYNVRRPSSRYTETVSIYQKLLNSDPGRHVHARMTTKATAQVMGSNHRTVNRVLRLSRLTRSAVLTPLESGPRLLTVRGVAVSEIMKTFKIEYPIVNSGHIYIVQAPRV